MAGLKSKWRVITVVIFAVCAGLAGLMELLKPVPNGCNMTYMYPTYIPISAANNISGGKYGLYLYHEGWRKIDYDVHLKQLSGVPVLFIPGNGGSYKQVRSLAAESDRAFQGGPLESTFYQESSFTPEEAGVSSSSNERQEEDIQTTFSSIRGLKQYSNFLDWFAVDLEGEHSAMDGRILEEHTEYVVQAIHRVLDKYKESFDARLKESKENTGTLPTSVILVGHSMGGFVARAAVVHPNLRKGVVETIITLSSPHRSPPVALQPSLGHFFSQVNRAWRSGYQIQRTRSGRWMSDPMLSNVVVISISGGIHDYQVRSTLASLEGIVPPTHGLTIGATGMRDVWLSMEHQSILWCNQLVIQVAHAMLHLIDQNTGQPLSSTQKRLAVFISTLRSGIPQNFGWMSSVQLQHYAKHLPITIEELGVSGKRGWIKDQFSCPGSIKWADDSRERDLYIEGATVTVLAMDGRRRWMDIKKLASDGKDNFIFVTNLAPCMGVRIHLWPEKSKLSVREKVPAIKRVVEVTSKMVNIPAGPAPRQIEPGSQTEQAPPSAVLCLDPDELHGFRFLTISVAPRPTISGRPPPAASMAVGQFFNPRQGRVKFSPQLLLQSSYKEQDLILQENHPLVLNLQAYMQFNEIGKLLERKLRCQNRIQWHFQYPLQDMGMFRDHMEMFKVHMGMLKYHIFRWREWLSFKGLFIVHFIVVLGALFLCAQAGAQAYIEQRVLPSVATAMGESLGRKFNLGRVQKLSLLRGTLSLESCSLGPHSEEFSCGELPHVRLQLRPLASLQQRQWVIKAVLVQPHVLITQKEDWTWLGIPTPLEKPLEKHRSNEEGIDLRTKARRLAREQAAIHSAEERNKLARKWAQQGYIFADIEEPRLLDKDTAMQAEEMVNSDSMNCKEEESTLERGFDVGETGIEEQLHHKCMEGVCNESRFKGPEWDRDFEHDRLDIYFCLKMSVSNVKLWLKENMVSPLLHQLRRSAPQDEYTCQKVAMQRRNLDYSAAAARTYFENQDKSKISDAEDGGGDTGKFGTAEDSQNNIEEIDEENSKCTVNSMVPVSCPHTVELNKELLERKSHAIASIKHSSTDSINLSLMRLEDVALLDRGIGTVGKETISLDQSPKHSSTNDIDVGKGSVYEAVVEPINESFETNKLCKSSENHCERRGKELVNAKCMSEKRSAHYSNTMDIVLQKIAGDINNNCLEDVKIARLGPYPNICDNSVEESHGKVISTETNREREGKEWSDSDITWGSSPVLASLRASRDMTQAKSTVDKSTQFHVLKGSLMSAFSDNFITFVQRMDRYIRNNFKQLAAEPESGDQKRVCIGESEQLLPVYLDSVFFRGGTLMLLGYGDNEPRVMENINGHLKFRKRYKQMHLQLTGRPKEWRTGYPSKDGGKLFINVFVDFLQQEWHVNIKARDLFAPLFERLLEIPIVWANGRATGEVHICMSAGDHFPNLHGQLDVSGLEFQVLDAPSSFSALSGSLWFQGQRIFLHNASCIFGEVPLEVSGDFGINPEDGEYHLLCQVPIVEVNSLMRTLKARPPLYPIAGSLKAVFNCQGPIDVPIFVGSAVISKKNASDINMPFSVASESVRLNKDNGAVAAFDRVPFSYMSANFTFNTDNCMADLYGIQATLVDGGEIRGAGNAWICHEGDFDDNAVDVNFSGNVLFDNVLCHYTRDGIQKMPVKLGDVNIEAKVSGSILRPSYDIKWTAPKAEGSFTDAHGEIIISDEAITISSSSSTFDLLTKIEIAYPNLLYSENKSSDLNFAFNPDIRSVDADLRLRGFDILGLFPFAPIGSSKPMHMKLTGRTKFEGHVVKSLERSFNEKAAWQDECVGMKASGLVGEVHLSGIKLNQLLVAPQLTGSLDISPQSFKLDATGRPDENLLIEIIGGLHLAGSETSLYDLGKRKVSLSLQKGQLRTNIFFQPGHLASLELRHLQLDELELASLRGMVQKAEIQLNFQKRRGQGNLSVMRPRFSGVQGESLDLSARWSGDVITIEKSVLEQAYSRYELQGEYVLPGTRDRFPGDREKGESLLKRAMAGQLGDFIASMGRWRLRLEVPFAEVAEMLPFARLLSRSIDPAVLSRSKELFMQGVQNVGFHAENLKKQLEAAQGYKCFPTDDEPPEAIPLPGLAELKGCWHGNFDASGGGNGDTTADFDFHGEEWEWGTYKTQRVVAVGSYSNNDGFRLDKIFIQRDKATLHADGTILGLRPNLHFAVLNFPVGLVPTLLQVFKSSSLNPMPSSWTPLTPIRGILHMEGDLRGSPGKPQCDVQVRLLDGAIGGVDLRRAEVVTSITSTNRFVFDANFEPVIHTGHVHVIGSLPMAPLGTDTLVEEDIERESARPMWVVRWMQDKGKITDRIDVDNKFGRERGEEGWEVQLTENLKGLDWNLRETGAVKIDATVKDGGMMLITALSPYAHWLQGSADITLQVRGTVDQPIFDGAATFHRASVSSPVLPIPLSNFGGTFYVKSNQLCINGLEGRVGRKGRLLLNGSLPLRSKKTYSGDKIEMKTENLEVRAKNLFSGQVDSQVEVTGSILEPDVSGMIKFSRGEAYLPQEKRTGAAITRLASNHKSLSTSTRSQMKAARNIVGFYTTQSSPLTVDAPVREPDTKEIGSRGKEQSQSKPQVAIHLRGLKLYLGPELRIVYPLILNFAVSGELELNGLADPKLIKPQGTITFEDGDVTLLATQVRVKRDHPNRAKFEPDQGLDPTLDLALVGADWQLKVQGRASNWQDNLVVTSPRSGDHDVLTQDEAARVFESQLAESLLEGDGQLAFQKLAAATLENLMPRIEVSREFGQARWRLVSAPQIPNLLSLDPTVDLFKSLANLSIGAEVEVQLGKHLQASVVRQLKESEMATQWTLLYQLTSRLRILFQSTPTTGNRLLFQYTATSQN